MYVSIFIWVGSNFWGQFFKIVTLKDQIHVFSGKNLLSKYFARIVNTWLYIIVNGYWIKMAPKTGFTKTFASTCTPENHHPSNRRQTKILIKNICWQLKCFQNAPKWLTKSHIMLPKKCSKGVSRIVRIADSPAYHAYFHLSSITYS